MPDTLVMTSPAPAKLHKPRRKSVEDYQRRIVDRIKDHFQRNKDEWESNLKRKINRQSSCLQKQKSCPNLNKSICTHSKVESECKACSGSKKSVRFSSDFKDRKTGSKQPSVRIMACDVINNKSTIKTMQLQVDVSEFLPNGEVTFRSERDALTVCAKYPCPESSDKSIQKVKSIPIPGLIETERIGVKPGSRSGAMILELKVAKT